MLNTKMRLIMKKLLFICLVGFTTVLCTGCLKLGYNIEIDKNDMVSVSETKGAEFAGFESSVFRNSLLNELESTIAKYTDKGYNVKNSVDGTKGALTFTKNGIVFNEAEKSLPKGFEERSTFESEIGLIKKKFKIHLFYNMPEAVDRTIEEYSDFRISSAVLDAVKYNIQEPIVSITTMEVPDTGQVLVTKRYADGNSEISVLDQAQHDDIVNNFLYPEAVLTIKIPVKATENNADNVVSDTEYQWYLAKEEQPVEIILEYEYNEYAKIAAAISLILLLGAVFFLVKKANNSDVIKGM